MFKRDAYFSLLNRLQEPRGFIQVLAGPRQVGKTTLVQQLSENIPIPVIYASADEPIPPHSFWISQQWETARQSASHSPNGAILVLDEIQKIPLWSSIVKKQWDEDTHSKMPLKIVLLGSTPLLVQKGLTESLAGRFEITPVTHWSYNEMQTAFSWTIDQYIYFGGYPGSAKLIEDETRWMRYVNDSLIETTLSRDILLLNPVYKPALLRQLFQLGCDYSGQILSYQKMMGQLQDAGNTTTLAHYLELLKGAGMLGGIPKFSGKKIKQRGSSPKLQVFNTALVTALARKMFREARQDQTYWGRLVESAVGAYLLNSAMKESFQIFYWREKNQEVDFILQKGEKTIAIEVKSSWPDRVHSGLSACCQQFDIVSTLLVGGQGLSLEAFFSIPVRDWFGEKT